MKQECSLPRKAIIKGARLAIRNIRSRLSSMVHDLTVATFKDVRPFWSLFFFLFLLFLFYFLAVLVLCRSFLALVFVLALVLVLRLLFFIPTLLSVWGVCVSERLESS